MGFFDGLTSMANNAFKYDWSKVWNSIWDKGVQNVYHGALTTMSSIWNGAAIAPSLWSQNEWSPDSIQQKANLWHGVSQMGSGLAGLGGGLGQLPIVRQIGEVGQWGATELYKRPSATFGLMAGDAANGRGFGNWFSGDAWRQAYDSSRYVTAGQAGVYSTVAAGTWLAAEFGHKYDPNNPVQRAAAGNAWFAPGPNGLDPRIAANRDQYANNNWLKYSSGSFDALQSTVGDPTMLIGPVGRAAKLKYWSNVMDASATQKLLNGEGKWSSFVSSNSYNKTYNFIRDNADNPEKVRQTVFNNHTNGGVIANVLTDVSSDKDLYDTTFRALYGDPMAWEDLTSQAPRIADLVGTKVANYSISQVAKNYGLGSEATDDAANALMETKKQAFVDSIANNRGLYGQVGLGVKAGGLLVGQSMPRLRMSSQWRVGFNNLLNYGPNTVLGAQVGPANYTLSSITRTLLPSSRGGRQLDLNNIDSLRIFRNNLLQSRLDQATVDNFVNMYSRATSPDSRFRVVNLAENAAFQQHALAHGVDQSAVDQILPALNQFRSSNRAFIQGNKVFVSSDARKLAEQYRAQQMPTEAENVDKAADQIDNSVKLGQWPTGHIASLDQDGNLALVPFDSPLDSSKPALLSQHEDMHMLQDWGSLDSALWWQGKGGFGTRIWKTKEAATALADAASSVWKISAIMRPGYIWRTLSDEAGGPLAVMGLHKSLYGTVAGVKNAFVNTIHRAELAPEVLRQATTRDKAARLGGKNAQAVDSTVVDTGPAAGSELVGTGTHPDLDGYTFGGGQAKGYATFEQALADGLISVPQFMDRFVEHGDNGILPTNYQSHYASLKNGLINKREAQQFVLDDALHAAGRDVYQSPAWQQSVIQTAINARLGKPQGVPGMPVVAEPFQVKPKPTIDLAAYDANVSGAAKGQRAIDAVNARFNRNEPDANPPTNEELTWTGQSPDWSAWEKNAANESMQAYRGSDFGPVNKFLRKPEDLTDEYIRLRSPDGVVVPVRRAEIAGHVDMLDQMMLHSQLSRDAYVIREIGSGKGTFGEHLNGDLTGHEWTDPGFVSTSAFEQPSGYYTSGATGAAPVLRILVPKGTGAINLSPLRYANGEMDEAEILLQRGLRFRVVRDNGVTDKSDRFPDGFRMLDVEVVPDKGLVVDPMSGASPKLAGTDLDQHFTLSNTQRMPAKSDNFDQVYKYVHRNMDSLLAPSSTLHAYIQPDGNLALSVAKVKPESDLEALKPGGGVRAQVEFRGVKGKPLRASGQAGFDIKVGPNPEDTIHVRGAFEGQAGDLFQKQVSSKGPMDAWIDRVTDRQHARLMANSPSQWTNVDPTMPGYETAWERAAMQLGHDPVARQFLRGASVDDVAAWMHNTEGGRAYQARLGPYVSNYYDQLSQVKGMVDTYAKVNPDRVEESASLRQRIIDGQATYGDLANVWSRDGMPQVHGASMQYATGTGYFMGKVKGWTESAFRRISDMPNDTFLRFPFAADRYEKYVGDAVASRKQWLQGDSFTQDDLDAIEKHARQRANVDVRKYLYDAMAQSDLAKGLRLVVPFGSALYDSAAKWGVVMRENPLRAGQVWKVWSAPDRAGMIQDDDGNRMELRDGVEHWYSVDPQTGARTELPRDFTPNGRNIVFRLPFGSPSIDGAKMNVSISKRNLQTFLDMPTFGPIVAIPANNFALSHPEFASNQFVQTFILPYGPSSNSATAAVPGNVRNWKDAWDQFITGKDTQQSENQTLAVYATEMVNYSKGNRLNAPTFEEARKKAAQIGGLRFMSRLAGSTASFTTPYQPYIDYYHMLEAKPRNPGDPTADEEFYNTMGSEFFWLTTKVTQNALGIPATLQSAQAYKKYSDMMQQFPDLAPLIEGSEGAGAFNKAVYEAQKDTPIRYGTQQNERQLLTLEQSVEETQKRLGWVKYSQFADALHADMADRGLTSLQQKGAEDLSQNKADFMANNMYWTDPYGTQQISPWYKDYSTQDQSKVESRLTQMRQIVQDPRLQQRDDIRGLIDYLDARDSFRQYMDAVGVKKLDANAKSGQSKALGLQWQTFLFNLKDSNLAFSQLYDRWLTNDGSLQAV